MNTTTEQVDVFFGYQRPAYTIVSNRLKTPFDVRDISFRQGQGGIILAYVDIRKYMERLEADAPGMWEEMDVKIADAGDGKVTVALLLAICGVQRVGVSDPDSGATAEAQAFKRACTKHGLGVALYHMPRIYSNQVRISDDRNKTILTNHLSIAVWSYDQVGLPVDAAARADVEALDPADRFDPSRRPVQQPQPQRQYQSNNGYQQQPSQPAYQQQPQTPPMPVPQYPASPAQMNILAKAGFPAELQPTVSKREAGALIDALIKQKASIDQIVELLHQFRSGAVPIPQRSF